MSVAQVAGTSWTLIPGTLVQISIGSGCVWGVDPSNGILYRNETYSDPDSDPDGSTWEPVPPEISFKYVKFR